MGIVAGSLKPLVSVSKNNLVWNLALINLAKQVLQIKYGFDEATYQISRALAFYSLHEDF